MQGELTFILFGKIKPYKGADTLIEAFARLPTALRDRAKLRIVGKPYMDIEPLHALIRARDLTNRVSIEPHFVPDDQVSTLFTQGTVAVFPYREIDSSGVLAQALAYARPVVASRIGCFAETLADGKHGHLVPPSDVAAFAAAMAHLLEDRDFAASCSSSALTLSKSGMDWSLIAQRTATLYQDAIGAEAERPEKGAAGRPKSAERSKKP
jgi:glycosyltransferase involved in cell wall biosynthesis